MTQFRNHTTSAYPASDFDIRRAHPNTSLPEVIDPETAAAFGFDAVTPTDPPTVPAGQMLAEGTPVQQPDGTWLQVWTLTTAPPPPVPQTVTNFQCRATLMLMPNPQAGGTMFDVVDAAMKTTGGAALAAWEHSPYFTRDSVLLNQMAVQFAIPAETLDTLFVQAGAITP